MGRWTWIDTKESTDDVTIKGTSTCGCRSRHDGEVLACTEADRRSSVAETAVVAFVVDSIHMGTCGFRVHIGLKVLADTEVVVVETAVAFAANSTKMGEDISGGCLSEVEKRTVSVLT
jgi:hypothetical protein